MTEHDTLDAPLDRRALVAELRRQVHDADPQDDYLPWRQVMLNLADSLAMTPSFPPASASIDSGD